MSGSKIVVGRAGITFRGGKWEARRAENIARLTFQHVGELTERNRAGAGPRREVELLTPRPVRVSASTSDEQIARAAAVEIYRSLLRS